MGHQRGPPEDAAINRKGQLAMLDAAGDARPKDRGTVAEDDIFFMRFEQWHGGIVFLAVVAGVLYALGFRWTAAPWSLATRRDRAVEAHA